MAPKFVDRCVWIHWPGYNLSHKCHSYQVLFVDLTLVHVCSVISLTQKSNVLGSGEKAVLVGCLPCRYKGMRSILRT